MNKFDRRAFLKTTGLALATTLPVLSACARPKIISDPFTLGIASGSPLPDGVVLWTRLAPQPLAGGGLDPLPISVGWEVASDEAFRKIVQRGTAIAQPDFGHSIHVEVDGLEPAHWYWYRFFVGDAVSPIGRTRTALAPKTAGEFRFAFASCQQYEQGYYAAHRHLAQEELDLVIFLGDYIYESSWGKNHVRNHGTPQPRTLEQYRNRYALYKSDPDLQRSHARFPWIVTWDDHEVANDYANDHSQELDPQFLARRTAGYQAFYEHMPLRASARPNGPNLRLYEQYDFGRLLRIYMLDDRQYRDYQVCPKPNRGGSNLVGAECKARLNEKLTLLGWEQETWLERGLESSRAQWDVIAQQTLMAQTLRAEKKFWTDGWDGYPTARRRLLENVSKRSSTNTLVVSGDVHANAVCDLKVDFDDPRSPVVATEFCGTSMTSQGPSAKNIAEWRANNPHIRYARGDKRGYVRVVLNERRAQVALRVIGSEKDPKSGISSLAQFVVENGRPGAKSES